MMWDREGRRVVDAENEGKKEKERLPHVKCEKQERN